MRKAYLCVLVHENGSTAFRVFSEPNPTLPADVLCGTLLEAEAYEYDEAARTLTRHARAFGLTKNAQLAAYLDAFDHDTAEMTGSTLGEDGVLRRPDGRPVSLRAVAESAARIMDSAQEEIARLRKVISYMEPVVLESKEVARIEECEIADGQCALGTLHDGTRAPWCWCPPYCKTHQRADCPYNGLRIALANLDEHTAHEKGGPRA